MLTKRERRTLKRMAQRYLEPFPEGVPEPEENDDDTIPDEIDRSDIDRREEASWE